LSFSDASLEEGGEVQLRIFEHELCRKVRQDSSADCLSRLKNVAAKESARRLQKAVLVDADKKRCSAELRQREAVDFWQPAQGSFPKTITHLAEDRKKCGCATTAPPH